MSVRVVLAVALLLAPGAVGVPPLPAPGDALPRLAPLDAFAFLQAGLGPMAPRALGEALDALPPVGPLWRDGVAAREPGLGAESHEEETTWFDSPGPGETAWINDSTLRLGPLWVMPDATLIIRNSTLVLSYLDVSEGGTLLVEDARLEAASPEWGFSLWSYGNVTLRRTHLVDARVTLSTSEGNPALVEDARVEVGAGGLHLAGPHAAVRGSALYNATGTALALMENATAEGNTLVNNAVGVQLGWGARFVGNDLSFNQVGARWDGAPEVDFRGNNVHDNYVDGVQGPTAAQGALDVSGNWWGGTPNVDGDGWSGAGVSSASHAAAPFPVPDLRHRLPFTPLRVQGDATWTGPVRLAGPTLVRGGTLTLDGVTLEADGFPIGSREGSRLAVRGSDVRNASVVLARSDDAFTDTRFSSSRGGTVGGIMALGGAPTVRGNTFVGLPVALVLMPAVIGEAPPVVTVEDNRFEGCGVGALLLLAQPTFRRNTLEGTLLGIVSVLSTSVVMSDNLVHGAAIGILSGLDQGFTSSGNSVYGSAIGFALLATTSPTVTGYEGRANGVNFAALGSQVTLSASNLYDNPLFGVVAYDVVVPDATTGQEVNAPGRARIDPTTYAADVDRGNVERVPPQKQSPSATPGRLPLRAPDVVATGETRVLAGNVTLDRPIVVRPGGALLVQGASVDAAGHLVGALPGGRLVLTNSTLERPMALVAHTTDARIEDATLANGTYEELVLVESHGATVRRTRFLQGMGVSVWDARVDLERNLFQQGVEVVSSVSPKRETRIRESFFPDWGVQVYGDAPVRVERSSFFGWDGVRDHHAGVLGSPAGAGTVSVDARNVWWNGPEGPAVPGEWRFGAHVEWTEGTAPVLFEPWLTQPFRASFVASRSVATDAEEVRFTDTSFDLDQGIVAREWDFGDGSPPVAERDPVHTFRSHGEKVVRLNVTDDRGLVSTAEARILVKALPVARLSGPEEALTLEELTFDAGASTDADGAIASYAFVFSDGTTVGPQASPVARHAFQRPGAHAVTLTVRDDEGHAGAPVTLPLTLHNRAPLASLLATPLPTTRADETRFLSTSVDLDGSVARTAWDFGDGSAPAEGALVTHRYAQLGTYVATLQVTDDSGATANASVEVQVVNALPTLDLAVSPLFVRPMTQATFTATAADRDGTVASYAWDFGDGTTLAGDAAQAVHAYAEEGDYLVRLTVTDNDGGQTTVERTLQVRWNFAPLASFDVAKGGNDATFGFRDTSVDVDGAVASRAWDFGDGGASTARNVSRAYRDPGTYVVRLTVTDDLGATATTTRTLHVDDVLAVDARVETGGATREPVLHVRTRWLNDTGVAASYNVTVWYLGVQGERRAWATATGVTGEDGAAAVPLRGPVPLVPPGRYELDLRAQTHAGHGGDLETAGGTMFFRVDYP